ncbi:hypothetical protein [Burkholderia cepacia]|uniref:hypothetical protein n=1 Tax=Burkholderia cepacia TaxID=292 RepID=UPI001CF46E1A|nr:hypothetical protein [Burkholderia cepacia]MCA8115683.1 hypothetical protein [Burkholderia cepacia]MCA8402770.1 hypothetical protein [Burkholderia cepacia]
MPYLGKTECHVCDREVDVSENVSGMAYYRCAACGTKLQMTNPRGDRLIRQHVRVFVDPDEAPPAAPAAAEVPANPGKSPEPKTPPVREKAAAGFWKI